GYAGGAYFRATRREVFPISAANIRRAVDDAATLGAACFVLVVGSLPAGSRDLARARAEVEEGTALLLEHA
ncbi:MAG TPA: sugar phosphate isomerase/epimerase, partial [Bauldia sp.]|nr:sugar phosphate isomerase/epimerase [Bauldia sp.]